MTARQADTVVRPSTQVALELLACAPGRRCLAWDRDQLYASCGYTLFRAKAISRADVWQLSEWTSAGSFSPARLRKLSSKCRLSQRLCRDGFHCLAVLPSGTLVAAVPHFITVLRPMETDFRAVYKAPRGTRPLHIAVTPAGTAYWGEYFDNPARAEVRIYGSDDDGQTWHVAHTFSAGEVRHVHNIVYDRWRTCLWVLTGDEGKECRIIRASLDLRQLDTVAQGTQQFRSVAFVPTPEAVYFASDTPYEPNHIYRLADDGEIHRLAPISASAISGCEVYNAVFFSTMAEPTKVNCRDCVQLYGSLDGDSWTSLAHWNKDGWPLRWLQYGAVRLAAGNNSTPLLAASSVAVNPDDTLHVWRERP